MEEKEPVKKESEQEHIYVCEDCTTFCTWQVREACLSNCYKYYKK